MFQYLSAILIFVGIVSQSFQVLSLERGPELLVKELGRQGVDWGQTQLQVIDLEKQRSVFEHNSSSPQDSQLFRRLYLNWTAFRALGPSNKIETTFETGGRIENGVLKGDLVLYLNGDPSFDGEHLWFLVNELARAKIKAVEGSLIISAPSESEFYFEQNRTAIQILPGRSIGLKPQIKVSDSHGTAKILNSMTTGALTKNLKFLKNGNSDLEVSGEISLESKGEFRFISFEKPKAVIEEIALRLLKQKGIEFKGDVKSVIDIPHARVLAKSAGRPLQYILRNLMVDPGDFFEKAIGGRLEIVKAAGGPTANIKPNSFANMAQLLKDAPRDFRLFGEFLSTFPNSNFGKVKGRVVVDRSRLNKTDFAGYIYGENGHLRLILGSIAIPTESSSEKSILTLANAAAEMLENMQNK